MATTTLYKNTESSDFSPAINSFKTFLKNVWTKLSTVSVSQSDVEKARKATSAEFQTTITYTYLNR